MFTHHASGCEKRRNILQRTLGLLLALALVIPTGACGGNSPAYPAPSAGSPENPPVKEEPAPDPAQPVLEFGTIPSTHLQVGIPMEAFIVFINPGKGETLSGEGTIVVEIITAEESIVGTWDETTSNGMAIFAGVVSNAIGQMTLRASLEDDSAVPATLQIQVQGGLDTDDGEGGAALTTVLASNGSDGTTGNGYSFSAVLSSDSRYVAFESSSTNLVPDDNNRASDVFIRDLVTGTLEAVSTNPAGATGNGTSMTPTMSGNARYVVFASTAIDLTAAIDTNNAKDVFVRDRQAGATFLVSAAVTGDAANARSWDPCISSDGRYIAYLSDATDLVDEVSVGGTSLVLHDRLLGTTEILDITVTNQGPNAEVTELVLSADGSVIGFDSSADNLVETPLPETKHVYVYDRKVGQTEVVSVSSTEQPAWSTSRDPSLSADGRYVAFHSQASNLVANDYNGTFDVFVRDRELGTTVAVSATASLTGNGYSVTGRISANGKYVAFQSSAKNLVAGDTDGLPDVYVRNVQTGEFAIAARGPDGSRCTGTSYGPSISANGRFIGFDTDQCGFEGTVWDVYITPNPIFGD